MEHAEAVGLALSGFGLFAGMVYWMHRVFVTNKTCESHHRCVKGQIKVVETKLDGFRELMDERTENIEKLIKVRNGDGPGDD